jgi:signal transduction histidine kinase/CHASE2 domain-containing sensor protein
VRRARSQAVTTLLVILASLSASVAVTWLAPSLSAASVNMLFRFRGQLSPPDDIVIVAIDDASLERIGKWPWPRSIMASALDRLTEARPLAVGLDVIYAESSDPADDQLLREAIRRNGRVVLPAQLTEVETTQSDTNGSSAWLTPLPELREVARAVGHAHADPDVDGVLRTVQLSKADATGERLWAFGLETLRVAEQIPPSKFEELRGSLRVGRYEIDVQDEAEKSTLPGVTIIRPNEMIINYLGPPRTFPYYSLSEVVDGRVPASTFTDKIVLIGAVAQTMGDTRITPFIHYGDFERQGGMGMPGVEVHANVIETIRRGVWLNPRPDWHGFGIALLIILCAAAIVRLLDGWRALAGLSVLLCLVITGSLYVFNHYFIIPPVVPMLTGFFTVVPLLLLNSSVMASRDLDRKLDKLARIQKRFMSRGAIEDSFSTSLSFLGSILRAETVALFRKGASGRALQLISYFGRKPGEGDEVIFAGTNIESSPPMLLLLRVPLIDETETLGMLLVKRERGAPFSESERQLAHEFGEGLAGELRAAGHSSQLRRRTLSLSLPHNIAWKLRAVDEITAHLIARISFMNQAFISMTDGLLVADITGQVVFANPAARPFWDGLKTEALTGKSLTELFVERGIIELEVLRETMREVLGGRNLLMDVELAGTESRFYTLRFSAVVAGVNPAIEFQPQVDDAQARESLRVIGLIVIINDITKRRELERVKAETLQLVSHELRTPLTSIRGLSEALLRYPVPADASPEMLETIHSEAVRMSELINSYLDVTRIESGSQPLTRRPVPIAQLITECVRLIGKLAADKQITINLQLEEPSPTLLCDAQLLTQAVNNLLSNAIKYSPADSEVLIGSVRDEARVRIYVRDHGYGIPKEFQERVFEKFYRLERDSKSDVVGTGLGLSLVKEIIERHGGQIMLESELNQGSTFTIHLPLQRV